MNLKRGVVIGLACAVLCLAGCDSFQASGERLYGGNLPTVFKVDSGLLPLSTGAVDYTFLDQEGVANPFPVMDEFSGASFEVPDGTSVYTNETVYHLDNDDITDEIVLTMRELSDAAVDAADVGGKLVGGASFLPLDGTFSAAVTITLPLHPNYAVTGVVVNRFDFDTGWTISDDANSSLADGGIATKDGVDYPLATFTVNSFGQYGIFSSTT